MDALLEQFLSPLQQLATETDAKVGAVSGFLLLDHMFVLLLLLSFARVEDGGATPTPVL